MPVWRTLFGATLLKSILHLDLLSSKLNILIQHKRFTLKSSSVVSEEKRWNLGNLFC